jgi:hypothetical protein
MKRALLFVGALCGVVAGSGSDDSIVTANPDDQGFFYGTAWAMKMLRRLRRFGVIRFQRLQVTGELNEEILCSFN